MLYSWNALRSPTVEMSSGFVITSSSCSSSSSSSVDSEVIDSPSVRSSEYSLSDKEYDAVDGAYSCLSGEDGRRSFFIKAGVNEGMMLDLSAFLTRCEGLGAGGPWSTTGSLDFEVCCSCIFAGAEDGSGCCT